MLKRFIVCSLLVVLMAQAGIAAAGSKRGASLDRVVFRTTASRWVSSDSALLVIAIAASLPDDQVPKARKRMLENLHKIAGGKWHITKFQRSQGRSGLVQLNVTAQVRLAADALAYVTQAAARVSQAGESYKISQIDFTPSLAAKQKVMALVRTDVYNQVKSELAQLNKVYPGQHYTVRRISFIPRMYARRGMAKQRMLALASVPQAGQLTVSNKVQLTATVVVAANRKATAPA